MGTVLPMSNSHPHHMVSVFRPSLFLFVVVFLPLFCFRYYTKRKPKNKKKTGEAWERYYRLASSILWLAQFLVTMDSSAKVLDYNHKNALNGLPQCAYLQMNRPTNRYHCLQLAHTTYKLLTHALCSTVRRLLQP